MAWTFPQAVPPWRLLTSLGVAKRPDLNELDVPEWAELALDKVEWRKLLQRIAL
jgi:hypothetical protein